MVEGKERIVSSGELEKKTMPELVEIYNSTMPRRKVKTFKSTAEAVRLILERLVEVSRRKPSRKPKARRGRPHELLVLRPRKGRSKSMKLRRSTTRELLVRMLRRGTTLEQVQIALGHTRKLARESLRQINLDLGYGIEEQEDGSLVLTER